MNELSSSSVKVMLVPANLVQDAWGSVAELVESLTKQTLGKYEPTDILQFTMTGQNQMWLASDGKELLAVALTEIINYPRKKVCRVAAAGKRRKDWQDFIKKIEEWALLQGCHSMEVFARAGWARVLTDYAKTNVVLEKTLGQNGNQPGLLKVQ